MQKVIILCISLNSLLLTPEIYASRALQMTDFTQQVKRAATTLKIDPLEKIYGISPYAKVIVADFLKETHPEIIVFARSPEKSPFININLPQFRNYFTQGLSTLPSIWIVSPTDPDYLEDVAQVLSRSNLYFIYDQHGLCEHKLAVKQLEYEQQSAAYILHNLQVVDKEPQGLNNPAGIFGRWVHMTNTHKKQ